MFSFGNAPDSPAPPASESVPGEGPLRALFKTSMGDIEVEFYEKEAPRTVANFVGLATGAVEWTDPTGVKSKRPMYDGTIFHRVIKTRPLRSSCATTVRACSRWRTRARTPTAASSSSLRS